MDFTIKFTFSSRFRRRCFIFRQSTDLRITKRAGSFFATVNNVEECFMGSLSLIEFNSVYKRCKNDFFTAVVRLKFYPFQKRVASRLLLSTGQKKNSGIQWYNCLPQRKQMICIERFMGFHHRNSYDSIHCAICPCLC